MLLLVSANLQNIYELSKYNVKKVATFVFYSLYLRRII